jgi:hypothetical protein
VSEMMRRRAPLGSRSNYAGPPAPEDVPGYRAPGTESVADEGRMARGTRLSHEAFAVIRSDRGLLGLALSAVALDLLIVGAFLGGASALAGADHRRLILLVAMCAASYPLTVVGTFFNVALLSAVARRWAGEQATAGDGLRVARSRLGAILAWSLLAATVGVVLSLAQRVGHFGWVERLVAVALDIAWGAATFFVIPALAADGVGPREALARSMRTVRARWAESATGTVAIGGATSLLAIPGMLMILAGYNLFASDPTGSVTLLAFGAALALPVLVYGNATSAVFTLAVYRYALDSPARAPFAEADLANPFVGGRKRTRKIRAWLGGLRAK